MESDIQLIRFIYKNDLYTRDKTLDVYLELVKIEYEKNN